MRSMLRPIIAGFGEHELMTRAAALAFYSALSFAPMLVLSLWLVSLFDPSMRDQVTDGLADIVGDQAAVTAELVIENARARPDIGNVAGLVSIFVTLFAGSGALAQLQAALNRVWDVRAKPRRAWLGWLCSRAQAAALLVTLLLLIVLSFAISGLIALYVPSGALAWRGIEAAMTLVVFTGVFACVFKVLPDVTIPWREALTGALITTLLFAIGKFGIGLYLDHGDVGGAYGPAGAVVVLLVWMYYASLILLLGAEVTRVVAQWHGARIKASPHAEPLPDASARTQRGPSADGR